MRAVGNSNLAIKPPLKMSDHGVIIPLSVIVTWPTPNYVNPPTMGWAPIGIIATLTVVVIVVFCLRMYARLVKLKNVGWDDWVMVAAVVSSLDGSDSATVFG